MTFREDYTGVIEKWLQTKRLTLSLDTSQYASGDVLAAPQELELMTYAKGGCGLIQSILVLDEDDQAQAMDIVFLRSNAAIGTENAAVSITDANAREIVGLIEVETGDYVDLVNSQIAHKENLGIGFQCTSDETSLWVAAISRGTGTYTAAGVKLVIDVLMGI